MTLGAPILEMSEVSKSFCAPAGNVQVLKGVNLKVASGEFIALTGPSGSGKSTFLHLSALLDSASGGKIVFDGEDVSNLEEEKICHIRKHKVGIVFQKYNLLPHRTVLDNVQFRFRYLNYDAVKINQLSREALAIVGLEDISKRPARLLSGGEMQRVAIARAIALRPKLLMADEPTGNLDSPSVIGVMECFKKLNQMGITILMVTHNEELLKYCSRHLKCKGGLIQ